MRSPKNLTEFEFIVLISFWISLMILIFPLIDSMVLNRIHSVIILIEERKAFTNREIAAIKIQPSPSVYFQSIRLEVNNCIVSYKITLQPRVTSQGCVLQLTGVSKILLEFKYKMLYPENLSSSVTLNPT